MLVADLMLAGSVNMDYKQLFYEGEQTNISWWRFEQQNPVCGNEKSLADHHQHMAMAISKSIYYPD